MKFVKLSHCVYFCDYHIEITTKYRHQWLNEGIFAYLKTKVKEIQKHYPLINFKTINYDKKQKDHLHLLVSIPPSKSVGFVKNIMVILNNHEIINDCESFVRLRMTLFFRQIFVDYGETLDSQLKLLIID